MSVKRKIILVLLLAVVLNFVGGCGEKNNMAQKQGPAEKQGLQIVTSFSILSDLVKNIAGDKAVVEYIVPIGENPHDYEMLPSELQKVTDADVFFINGFGLEGGMERILGNVTNTPVVSLSEGIIPIPLVGDDAADPHAWLDASLVITYVMNIRDTLISLDPDNEQEYKHNAEVYINQLNELDSWIREQVAIIPQAKRVIVISENAFKYYGEAYGFQTEGIWELNSHEEGTPQQISRVVDLVTNKGLPAVFVETTVDKRYMQTIANETGVPIAGAVYTDALGHKGSGADTYINMMKYNTEIFVKGLGN